MYAARRLGGRDRSRRHTRGQARPSPANMAASTEQHEELGLTMETLHVNSAEAAEGWGHVPASARRILEMLENISARLGTGETDIAGHAIDISSQIRELHDSVEVLNGIASSNSARLAFLMYKCADGTSLSPLHIVDNDFGRLPIQDNLRPLFLLQDIVGLDDGELDDYLRFYLGQRQPPNLADAVALPPRTCVARSWPRSDPPSAPPML
ncbi:hypothetical protein DFJ74DRAFT_679836 [Hyaloraphidium curvatum]|nr:hypothetical protein DFJ74DRAFT_679836 [Hyaloraphidium curvatum]